jgi:hypothetical protein
MTIAAPNNKNHVAEDLGISPVQRRQLLKLTHDTLAAGGE